MRRKIAVFLIVALCMTLTSCLKQTSTDNQKTNEISTTNEINNEDIMDQGPVKGGTIKLFSTSPDTLNPIASKNMYVQDFSNLIFEGLFKLDKDQSSIPVLCDQWDVSTDGLIWTFHIRENVFWHDRTTLTAEDVKFTFDQIQNKTINSIFLKNLENVAMYTAVDKNNFRIFLKKPSSFTKELMTFPIISQNYYSVEDATKEGKSKDMLPMGTGPFKMGQSIDPKTISLLVNTNWWNAKAKDINGLELPYIAGVDIKIYQNASDAINAFQTRDIDAAVLQTSEFSKYNGRSDLVVRKYVSKNYEYAAFNLQNPVLGDKAVRQSIAYSIDKIKMIDDVIPGEAVASDLPIIPDTWLNNTSIIAITQDKTKAKEVLSMNGWKDENGVLTKNINGKKTPLKFTITVNDFNDTRYKIAEKIAEQLKETGMDVSVVKLAWDVEEKAINTRKFDMVVMGCKITSVPDISFAYSSAEILSGFNVSGYKNPDVDNLLAQIATENDSGNKKVLFTNFKNIINDEVPYIGLFFYNNAMIYSKKIRGEMGPSIWNKFDDISQWYIPVKQ